MGEWLGDTPIFQETMTTAERAEFELFKTPVKAIDTKETDMAKKNDAQTTIENIANEQEDTMTENTNVQPTTIEGVAFKTRKNGNWYHNRAVDTERHAAIRKNTKFGRTKGIEPTTCIPNESVYNITTDEDEIALLGKACKKFGWKNGVCTPSKAGKNHGRPNPDYKGHGWLVWFEQRYYKTGERAGQPMERGCTIVYPMEAFIWDTESGMPEFDVQKALLADARKAAKEARDAEKASEEADKKAGISNRRKKNRKGNTKKTETIKDQPVAAASPDVIAELQRSNDELRAMNAELMKRFDALSAFMIANKQ